MIFILIFVFAISIFAQGEEDFRKATLEYINGNLEEALIYATTAHEKNPQNEKYKKLLSQIYIERASSLIADGKYDTALKYLSRAEELKLSLKKVKELKKAIKKIEAKKTEKKPVKKVRGKVAKKKISQKKPSETEIPRERIIEKIREYQPVVVEKKIHIEGYRILLVLIVFIILAVAGIVFYIRTLIKHREQQLKFEMERALKESERVKRELHEISQESKKLKEELEAEKRRKLRIIKAVTQEKKALSERKTYEKVAETLKEVKTQKRIIPIKTEDLLPEYTDIPTSSEEIEKLLKTASLSERSILIWGLGNKKDMKAVEILEKLFENPLDESEEMEILKSLKKIYLRPGVSDDVKSRIFKVLSKARRKGIII